MLAYERLRYAKLALGLVLLCTGLYAWDQPQPKPGGNTWLGYGLGTLAALLVLWLMAYGMRKRAYRSNFGSVRGWLSAHVYLGVALAVVATLHAAFEFGWNVHTLAYVLTMTVIVSGMCGVALYLRNPALMSNLLDGKTLLQLGQGLHEIDERCRRLSAALGSDVQLLVETSARGSVFGSGWQRFSGTNPRCATQHAVDTLGSRDDRMQRDLQAVHTHQFRRLQQLQRIRRFVQLKTWTDLWLLFHVPLSFALLAALIAHVVSVFFYW